MRYLRADNARGVAVNALAIYEKENTYANLAFEKAISGITLSRTDRAFAFELAMGTIRRMLSLDYIVSKNSSRSVKDLDPLVRATLRTGAFQIFFMNSVPSHAAVSESVEIVKKSHLNHTSGFVNAVLRKVSGFDLNTTLEKEDDSLQKISLSTSMPLWIVELFVESYGPLRARMLCELANASPKLMIRLNALKDVDVLNKVISEEGLVMKPAEYLEEALYIENSGPLNEIKAFNDGFFSVQDESSMFVAHAVDPEPHMNILDLCSAPGGKATHIAELMNDSGSIIACDLNETKLFLVEEYIKRLGIKSIVTKLIDATVFHEKFADRFDRCLVDAPCSGLGVLSRRADSKYRKSKNDIDKLSEIQRKILNNASKYVKPGGMLIYSTCTISKKENEEMVNQFLQSHENFRKKELYMSFNNLRKKIEGLTHDDYCFQFMPDVHKIDGFFIAKMERVK